MIPVTGVRSPLGGLRKQDLWCVENNDQLEARLQKIARRRARLQMEISGAYGNHQTVNSSFLPSAKPKPKISPRQYVPRKIELSDADRLRIICEEHGRVLRRGGDLGSLLSTKDILVDPRVSKGNRTVASPTAHMSHGSKGNNQFEADHTTTHIPQNSFISPFLQAEVALTEYQRKTCALSQPNEILTSGAINVLGELSEHVSSPLRELLQDLHEQLLQVIYADDMSTPHFTCVKTLRDEVKNLRIQRAKLMEKQQLMKQEHERHKNLFDDTFQFWQQGLLKRTFNVWKRAVAMGKQHMGKVQNIFAKWYQGDDLLRIYFSRWCTYRQAAVRQRLLDDLQRNTDDLAYHERIAAERERILRKKREQIASLEEEYEKEKKACEELRAAVASESENSSDIKEAKITLMEISRKLRKLSDSIGNGVLRFLMSTLKQFSEAPDAQSVINGIDQADGDEKVLLSWLRRALGVLYESDEQKRILLTNAHSVTELAHLGLCLDLVRCIPQRIRMEASDAVSGDQVSEYADLDSYNMEQVEIVTVLMQVEHMCRKDVRSGTMMRRGSRLSLSRGSTLRGKELLELNEAQSRLSLPGAFLLQKQPSASNELGTFNRRMSSRRSLLERQNSMLLHTEVDGQSQNSTALSRAAHTSPANNFVDESLPIVAMTEILEAVEADSEEDSTFLSAFLSQFMLYAPLLPSIIPSEDETFQSIAHLRNEFQRVLDQAMGAGLPKSDGTGLRQPPPMLSRSQTIHSRSFIGDAIETESNFEMNQAEVDFLLNDPDNLIDSVEHTKRKWRETLHDYFHRIGKLQTEQTWPVAALKTEDELWTRLLNLVSEQINVQLSAASRAKENGGSGDGRSRRSMRSSHGSFVRKHGVIIIGNQELSDCVEETMIDHGINLPDLPQIFLEYGKLLSIALDRYESPVDIIKEAKLVDLNKLFTKKYKVKLTALCASEGKSHLQLLMQGIFFVADWQFDLAIEENASLSFEEVVVQRVLEPIKECSQVTSGDLAMYNLENHSQIRHLFHKIRNKSSPIDQVSLGNWKQILETNRWLQDKGSVTKQLMNDIFHACNSAGEDCEKGAQGLSLTEFKKAIILLVQACFPSPFKTDKEKLIEFISQLKK